MKSIKEQLIFLFTQWGLPKGIHVDNGLPFGSPMRDTTPVLALWLIGLGITVSWSRARTPTDNAKVERCQAVTANWAEPQRCSSLSILQQRLEKACSIQREQYPTRVCHGKTRLEQFPELTQNPRKWAKASFQLQRVIDFLAKGKWVRKTSKKGQFTLFAKRWNLGSKYAREDIFIHLDSPNRQWVVMNDKGKEIKRFSIENQINQENITNLVL
ncbi:MAG: hypothetical protein KDD63_09880 [Bacteroidetes bacterium]|nr:hypothetical protein [Bacteroidota bacterium]MCB0852522.1 hypothetical protein [Bacteroidota bacterium]